MQSKKKSDKSLQQKKMKQSNVGTRLKSKDIFITRKCMK